MTGRRHHRKAAAIGWATRIIGWREKFCFGVIIVLGSVTGVIGIANSVRFAASPTPHCSITGVWKRQSTKYSPYDCYFAVRDDFPSK